VPSRCKGLNYACLTVDNRLFAVPIIFKCGIVGFMEVIGDVLCSCISVPFLIFEEAQYLDTDCRSARTWYSHNNDSVRLQSVPRLCVRRHDSGYRIMAEGRRPNAVLVVIIEVDEYKVL
jgi:hypothetical protein